MLDDFYAFAQQQLITNHFLTGIIGGVVLTGLGVAFKSIPNKIYTRIRASLISDITLNSATHGHYDDVASYVSKFVIQRFNRSYTLSEGSKLVTGYGNAFGFYRGVLFLRTREEQDNKYNYQEKMAITFFTRKRALLEEFVAEAVKPKDADLIRITNFDYSGYAGQVKRPKRDLKSVFVNYDTKDLIVEKLQKFYDSEDLYRARGINYKYCVLLHGKPGTGKTSLIAALAAHFNVDLNVVDHFDGIQKASNYAGDYGNDKRCIVVVEDIDTMVLNLNREKINPKKDEPEAISSVVAPANPTPKKEDDGQLITANALIHNLLQTLDGFNTPWGMVVFITTNYIDRLDEALIRPGRVDMKVELKYLEKLEIRNMFKTFYGDDDHKHDLIDSYINSDNYRPQRGAYLQSLFLEEDNPLVAVAKLHRNLDYNGEGREAQ